MKNYFKYSILITLTLLMMASLVRAQSVPIGKSTQGRPFESNPTVATVTNIQNPMGAAYDGNLGTAASVIAAGTPTPASGTVIFSGFKTPSTAFTIAWVDVKIKYKYPGTTTNGFSIYYLTSGTTYTKALQTAVSGANAKFDRDGAAQVRPWTNIATTSGLAWSWTDVSSFKMRIMVTKGANPWADNLDMFEIWLTIYASAPPISPTGTTALSVMPPSILSVVPGEYFFVDVYANGLPGTPGLWGYQVCIKYDPNIITAVPNGWFTYWPFGGNLPSSVGPDYVSVSFMTFNGDGVGFTGTVTPLARIYFQVKTGGATPLDLIDDRPTYITELKPVGVEGYVPALYDSWLGAPRYLSADPPTVLNLANDPTGTDWREIYPSYNDPWRLTLYTDTNGDTLFSAGDEINMTSAGWMYTFNVDAVTITIHWTFKTPDTGIGKAEPATPKDSMPAGTPVDSKWHIIYPTFFKMVPGLGAPLFMYISAWTDTNSNGNFDASDEFTYYYDPYDVVLVGTPAPAKGSTLTVPGATNMYYDADGNGVWDVGEPAIDDVDMDTFYFVGIDTVLTGTEPPDGSQLSAPGPFDKFYDANTDGTWSVGEPAVRDADASGTYTPQEFHSGTLDAVSTDILVSQKWPPSPPGVPEFPLGLGIVTLIAPMAAIAYIWRLRRNKGLKQ